MAVLYRKYRPQTFSELVGQEAIIRTLQNQVKSGSVGHAYLFTGSRGVGKTSIARILAKALNCPNQKNGDPCGKCDTCSQITAGTYLDLVEIDAASNTGVDNIRELIEHVKFSPSMGQYKVFIIDEVHMLSKGAFNALLKTLEEPPKHAVFILATTEIQKLPATIISRTQRFDFSRLTKKDLQKYLSSVAKAEHLEVSEEILGLIGDLSEGGARDALSLLDKVSTLGKQASLEDVQRMLGVTDISLSQGLVGYIAAKNAEAIPDFFERLVANGADFTVFNRDLLEYLRKLLVHKITGSSNSPDFEEKILEVFKEQSVVLLASDILFLLRLFLRSFKEIPGSPSSDLPVLIAAIEAAQKKQESYMPSPVIKSVSAVQKPIESPIVSEKNNILKSEIEEVVVEPVVAEVVSVLADPAVEAIDMEEGEISLSEARSMWPSFVDSVKEINGPLANVIRKSPVMATQKGQVIVEVKYLFDKQNLDNPKNQQVISSILEKLTGKRMRVVAVIGKEEKIEQGNTKEMIGDALQIFGGEVVE
jgi:DNA polymerase-3 subunit gamma/tau